MGDDKVAHQVARELAQALRQSGQEDRVQIAPLYGGLSEDRQRQAVMPAPEGLRKVVLAANQRTVHNPMFEDR